MAGGWTDVPEKVSPSGAFDDNHPIKRVPRVPGEEGFWVFILGDMTVFALFFGTILVTRGQQPEVFVQGQQALHSSLAIVNTLLLLVGSLLVVRGVARVRTGGPGAAYLFAAAAGCAAGFAAIKAVEYTLLIGEGHTPVENDFFMYYFAFTGIHLLHLLIGGVMLVVLARMTTRRRHLPEGRVRFVEAAGCYWHMVDGLWLLLFPLLYLVR